MVLPFSQAVDAAFQAFGVEVTYTDGEADPRKVMAIPQRPDQQVDTLGQTTLHTDTATFQVRVSEMPTPAAGDTIDYDGIEYIIQGEPRRDDPRRLVWTLDTRPA